MAWEYLIANFSMSQRWTNAGAAGEVTRFNDYLNILGGKGWEMVGYEAVPISSMFGNKVKGYAYLLFMKRLLNSDGSSAAATYTPEKIEEMEMMDSE